MNAVIGMTSLLLNTALTSEQRDYVETVRTSGDALLAVINDILDFSKIEAGRMQLEETEFALDGVLDNVTGVLLQRAQEKGLELQYVVEPDVPPNLNGDPLRLGQILINLVGNANQVHGHRLDHRIRPSPAGRYRPCPPRIRYPGHRHRHVPGPAGKPVQRLQPSRYFDYPEKFGGTGLGLTISKRLAQLMKGDVWVRSQLNVGSTFTFSAKLALGRGNAQTPHLAQRRALVVDDSPLARSILIALLEKQGFHGAPGRIRENRP
jgi:two-component system sensor histidine kinase/response regulator